ncbi:MAG: thioredoxin family protein [Chitinophagales bacterium]|nr:thioredoxin family protein [Chitinophagales bacterium]
MTSSKIVRTYIVLMSAFFLFTTSVFAEGINFENITFKKALEKAKAENKLVFVNVYAVWCGPCKLLKKTTFQSDKVAAAINNSFVNLDIDAEKGEGIEFSKTYNVKAHPLILIIRPDGKVEKRILGYMKDNQLLSELKGLLK